MTEPHSEPDIDPDDHAAVDAVAEALTFATQPLISNDLQRAFAQIASAAKQTYKTAELDAAFERMRASLAKSPMFSHLEQRWAEIQIEMSPAFTSLIEQLERRGDSIARAVESAEITTSTEIAVPSAEEGRDDLQFQMWLFMADWMRRQEKWGPTEMMTLLSLLIIVMDYLRPR